MDEPPSLTLCARRRVPRAGFFLFAAVLSACASAAPQVVPPPAAKFGEIVTSVSQTRGLEWKQEITLAPAAASNSADLQSEFYNGAPLAAVEQAYKAIGLLAGADDLKKSLADLVRLESLIGYDRKRASATWSPAAAQLGAPLAKLDADKARDLAPVLAAMRALQEQHFQSPAAIDRTAIEDRRSALAAVAAGDALLTFMMRGLQKEAPNLEIADQIAATLERLAGDLPDFLRRRLTFPYRHGSRFVYWAFKAKGWQGVNGIYADPPRATTEIIHPEKYFIEREPLLLLFPPHLLRRFKQPAAIEQTLGEDAIAGLLTGASRAQAAEEIAAGWRGDQLFHFAENGGAATLWFTSWRTEKQAGEFFRTYWAALETRHRVRFEMAAPNAPALAVARERGWLLQRIGDLVLLVSASPASALRSLAAEAWKDLEVDKETDELRFDSAHAPAQFPPRSR